MQICFKILNQIEQNNIGVFCTPEYDNFLRLLGYYEETTMEQTAGLGLSYTSKIHARVEKSHCSVISNPITN